jgi:putative acetyltransferase
MATARPPYRMRPMLPADAPALVEIFRASIEGLTEDDYSPEQQEAWASAADDEESFAGRLASWLTLVATLSDEPVAFASLEGKDHIKMLYVHPEAARQGVASMLVDALEKLAGARGTKKLTVDASDTARDFFAGRGYTADRRNSVFVADEWLSNTTMVKTLAATVGQEGGAGDDD